LDYLPVDQDMLLELVLAADYMNVKPLLDWICVVIAKLITQESIEVTTKRSTLSKIIFKTKHGPAHIIMSYLLTNDPEAIFEEYCEKAEVIFAKLSNHHNKVVGKVSLWRTVSEIPPSLEEQLPPGALEELKGVLEAKSVMSLATTFRETCLTEIFEKISTGRGCLHVLQTIEMQMAPVNKLLKKMEAIAAEIERLGKSRSFYLSWIARIRSEDTATTLLETTLAMMKEAMEVNVQTARATTEKDFVAVDALEKKALVLEQKFIVPLREWAVFFRGIIRELRNTVQENDPVDHILAKNLGKSLEHVTHAIAWYSRAAEGRARGSGKEANALELASQYALLAAEAVIEENISDAGNNFFFAGEEASSAGYLFSDAFTVRASGNEKSAQAHEKSANIALKAAEAYLSKDLTRASKLSVASSEAALAVGLRNRQTAAAEQRKQREAESRVAAFSAQSQAVKKGSAQAWDLAAENWETAAELHLAAAEALEKEGSSLVNFEKEIEDAEWKAHTLQELAITEECTSVVVGENSVTGIRSIYQSRVHEITTNYNT
jgi:hypothetical protein